MVDRFESEVADRVGVRAAVALSSGTAALHLGLLHHGAAPGRVVVAPSMTFVAVANVIRYTGAEPVFVDSLDDDGNLDPRLLLDAVRTLMSEGADVAAVISVDLFGRCVDYSAFADELADLGIPLIEDAAEAFGATLQGRAAGSFGSVAALSFNGNKIVSTSGGGMLLTDDPDLARRARYLSTQAREPELWYEHTEVGFNYRMSNILAALGLGQLHRLDEMMARRRQIRDRYAAALADVPGVRLLGRASSRGDGEDNCWLTCITVDGDLPLDIHTTVTAMMARGIEVRHLWKPMHLQPMFEGARSFLTGASGRLFETGLALPSGSELSDADIDRVTEALVSLWGH